MRSLIKIALAVSLASSSTFAFGYWNNDKWISFQDEIIMTGEPVYSAVSTKNIAIYGGPNEMRIGYKCLAGEIRFFLDNGAYLGPNGSQVDVLIRADDKKPKYITMTVYTGANEEAYYKDDVKSLATYIMGATKLTMQIAPRYRDRWVTIFKMVGSDQAIRKTYEFCDDSLDQPNF